MKHVWRIFRAPKNLRKRKHGGNLNLPMPTLIKSSAVSLQNFLWTFVQLSNHWKNCILRFAGRNQPRSNFVVHPQQKESQLLHLSLLQYQQWCLFKKQQISPPSYFSQMGSNISKSKWFLGSRRWLRLWMWWKCWCGLGWMHGNLLPIWWTCNMYLYVDLPYLKLT